MRIAHVRERGAPTGSPWRLVGALDAGGGPARWLDLEVARWRAVRAQPQLAHDSVLHRVPVTTLDDHLARGLRIEALRELIEGFEARDDDDEAVLGADALHFGPPVLRPPSIRDFYAFEGHVEAMWARRGGAIPERWYTLPVFYFTNASEIRGDGDPIHAPRGSVELDFELEVAAVVDTPGIDLAADRAEAVIGGYTIFDDFSARDLQREEMALHLGPAKGKDFASAFGPSIVTPDELADRREGTGFDLAMTVAVNGDEIGRGRWADAQFGFGEMLERASADVRLRPGDLIGSGTVDTGCLLQTKEETLGRYLEPGDVVTLAIERLGELRNPIVARPG